MALLVTQAAPLLLVVVGPTASGKSALALALAQQLQGEVVSCDSVAVYQGLEIGAAKPTTAERASVPHHMLDVASPLVRYDAGSYARAARACVRQIAERGRLPIVAGGTGLYLRALLDGLSPLRRRDPELRARLQEAQQRSGSPVLHRLLRRIDPAAADRIHPHDAPKLIRALELVMPQRRPLDESYAAARPEPLTGFNVLQVGLMPERAALYQRINARCAAMFQQGLLEETRQLVEQYGADAPALQALGYAQCRAVLRGQVDLATALAQVQQGHRNYSKRQATWFRKDTRITWLKKFGADAVDDVRRLIACS